MLLRHFQLLIGHGKARDKPVPSTTRPEGFGSQAEQQQEQPPLHGSPRQGHPGSCSTSRSSWRSSALLGDSGGSPTPPAALSSTHAPLPSTTFGFFPAMTSPSHSRSSSNTFVTGSREMSLQSREQVKPRCSHQAQDELQGSLAPQEPLEHSSRTTERHSPSKNQGVTPSPVISWKILGENKPVLQPEDSRVSSVLDYRVLPSCFHPEKLLINPLSC